MLKKTQEHIGKRCVILLSALVKAALEVAIKEACGFIPEVQKTICRCYNDAIFIFTREILFSALNQVYPEREKQKYRGLMATCFEYAYVDILGKEKYQEIKKNKGSYPIHQYIEDNKKRQLCICYMNTLASQIAARNCRVAEGREYTSKLFTELLRREQTDTLI